MKRIARHRVEREHAKPGDIRGRAGRDRAGYGSRRAATVLVVLGALSACRSDNPLPPGSMPRDAGVEQAPPPARPDATVVPDVSAEVPVVDAPMTNEVASETAADRPVDVPAPGMEVAADVVAPPDTDPACGNPGQACCANRACNAGCCVGAAANQRCIANGATCTAVGGESGGTCNNGRCSGCGAALNQPCCAGQICSGTGLVCEDEVCTSCGTEGGSCCANDSCGDGLACDPDNNGGTCVSCGAPGQQCCPGSTCKNDGCCVRQADGEEFCMEAGQQCRVVGAGNGGLCMAGRCTGCGHTGQACCRGDLCYVAGEACIGGSCGACGAAGQPACPGSRCASGCVDSLGKCVALGVDCGQNAGTCTPDGSCRQGDTSCGGINQPCCGLNVPPAGAFCTKPGTTCSSGFPRRCGECGGIGQPCCAGEDCREGRCGFGGICRR